jgi:hypothetical protein
VGVVSQSAAALIFQLVGVVVIEIGEARTEFVKWGSGSARLTTT